MKYSCFIKTKRLPANRKIEKFLKCVYMWDANLVFSDVGGTWICNQYIFEVIND